MLSDFLTVLLLIVLIFVLPGVVLTYLLYGKSALSFIDSTRCQNDGEKMQPSGYVAHEFQRHYVCPLCNWSTYVSDPVLKQAKLDRLASESKVPDA